MRLSYKILAVAAYSATLAFAQVIKVRGFDACGRTLFFLRLCITLDVIFIHVRCMVCARS